METEQELVETIAGGVATLRFNRPDRMNAFSPTVFDALIEALPRLGRDPSVGVIVLTGTGRAFSAGGDVKAMQGSRYDVPIDQRIDEMKRKHQLITALMENPKITIAAVNGAAAGAGICLMLACDIRLAVRSARFATGFVKIGYCGDFGGTWLLSQYIGVPKARQMYLMGTKFTAEEADRMGLLTKLLDDDALEEETAVLAQSFVTGPRLAYRAIKENFRLMGRADFTDVLAAEIDNQVRLSLTQDHKEATAAFREGRAPTFIGR